MKNIYNYETLLSFDNGETWEATSHKMCLHYTEAKEDEIIHVKSFKEAYNLVMNYKIPNSYVNKTLFRKLPMISLFSCITMDIIEMTEKTFKPFIIKKRYRMECFKYSIKDLQKYLRAEDYINWYLDQTKEK